MTPFQVKKISAKTGSYDKLCLNDSPLQQTNLRIKKSYYKRKSFRQNLLFRAISEGQSQFGLHFGKPHGYLVQNELWFLSIRSPGEHVVASKNPFGIKILDLTWQICEFRAGSYAYNDSSVMFYTRDIIYSGSKSKEQATGLHYTVVAVRPLRYPKKYSL